VVDHVSSTTYVALYAEQQGDKGGDVLPPGAVRAGRGVHLPHVVGRGLHSSTFQLNLSRI